MVGWFAVGLYRSLGAGEIGLMRGALLGGAAGVVVGEFVAQLLYLPPLLVAAVYYTLGQSEGDVTLVAAQSAWLTESVIGSLTYALPACVIGGFLSGLARGELVVRTTPTEGIRRSARSAGMAMVVLGCLVALVTWLLPSCSPTQGCSFGVLTRSEGLTWSGVMVQAIPLAMFVGLLYGGRTCVQHLVLRAQLWRAGLIPWNYPQFLDYASERILLRRVGGGYIFVHRLLLEYFAANVLYRT
jgi:hypothetical protein